MNYRQMEIFLTVAEESSLSQAGKRLYITQPAITQTLRKIENELGGPLFAYQGKQKKLTPLGLLCVDTFRRILHQCKRLENEAQEIMQETRGELSIYIPLRRAMRILPIVLPAFSAKYPHVTLRILEGKMDINHMFLQLLDGRIDFVITLDIATDPQIISIPFCDELMSFIATRDNPLARRLLAEGRASVPVEELLDEVLVLPYPVYRNRMLVDQMFHGCNRAPNIFFEVQTVELAKSLAVSGIAGTIVPEIYIRDRPNFTDADHYAIFPIQHAQAVRTISISYIKTRGLSRFQRDFIDILTRSGFHCGGRDLSSSG